MFSHKVTCKSVQEHEYAINVNKNCSSNNVMHRTTPLTLLLLNPTSLVKKDALSLLQADLKSNNVDVALICETWFTSAHNSDYVDIPG